MSDIINDGVGDEVCGAYQGMVGCVQWEVGGGVVTSQWLGQRSLRHWMRMCKPMYIIVITAAVAVVLLIIPAFLILLVFMINSLLTITCWHDIAMSEKPFTHSQHTIPR